MEVKDILNDCKENIKDFIEKNPDGVILLRGSTASGKSGLSMILSEKFDIEIVGADSRQIYKYMDIGTDKVSQEAREKVPHHQIDIVYPDQIYTAGQRKEDTEEIIKAIQSRNRIPVIVGGTGLYINAIYRNFSIPEVEPDYNLRADLEEKEENNPGSLYKRLQTVDPEEAERIHPHSLRQIIRALEIYEKTGKPKSDLAQEYPVKRPLLMIGLWRERDDTNRRINSRIKTMFQEGLVDEVKFLLEKGYDKNLPSMQGIGYKEVLGYLEGEYGIDRAEELLKRNTHRFGKRQRSWFKRYIQESKVAPKENVTYKFYKLSEE